MSLKKFYGANSREAMIEAAKIRADRRRHDDATRFITNCSGSSCFDNYGNHYQNLGGGQQLGSDGRVCQRTGNMLQCP